MPVYQRSKSWQVAGIGDRCRLDRIVKPDGVGLGHAILPKEIEI